jgi:nucleotide-binding universal stress UspA family protein
MDGRRCAMKLLVGVDDSPCSDAAVDLVRKIPWPQGSRVIVASAVGRPVSVYPYPETYMMSAGSIEGLLGESRKRSEDTVSRHERSLRGEGLSVEGRVLEGDPGEGLIDLAKKERVDLIVVGSHGRSGLAKLLMGSVASHVVAHAPCSALVVKLGVGAAAAKETAFAGSATPPPT